MATDRAEKRVSERTDRDGNDPDVLVIGGQSACGVAVELAGDYEVTLVTDDESVARTARTREIEARRVELTDGSDLRRNAAGAEMAVVAAELDRVSLLVAQLLRVTCGVEEVVVRINDPENRDVFDDLDVELLDEGSLLAPEVERALFEDA